MFKTKIQKNITIFLTFIYILLLIWIILFKLQINFSELSYIKNINLIPFHESMFINGHISLKEIIYNIIIFIPLGIYTNIFKSTWSFIKKVLPSLGVSLSFEILQYLFAIGASDITDVIENTLGGTIGIFIYILFHKAFKEKTITIINIIATIISILAICIIILLEVVNI